MTTRFNAKAKALRGKISSGFGNGRSDSRIPGMRKLNLGQIKKHLHSEARFKKEHSSSDND